MGPSDWTSGGPTICVDDGVSSRLWWAATLPGVVSGRTLRSSTGG
ncbi:hypothetical protein DVS28_a1932 [Euzebya pacifica]|uniref:Uncharacterized protein n=1 Tax=Euzebya pacifica TaxID=1608957 RepID=A0A346XWM0_9ACTN|nr:hypothetical protein DVS28_a1932 [Euzebya pacifica]